MPKKKSLFLALLFIPTFLVIKVISYFPETVETHYSNGIYPIISKLSHYSLGWIPFSFGDVFYTILGLYAIIWFVKNTKRIYKDTLNWFLDVFAALSVLYLAFHVLWAFNYYRNPLHENLNINADYNTEQLVEVTKTLISKSNNLHSKLAKNDTLKVEFPFDKTYVINQTTQGYQQLKTTYPHLEYKVESIKNSLFSYPLTKMGFSGYLNPFTNEAQPNGLIPIYKYPTTCAHEVAHQLGYAAENEANFIGCLASINHPNDYFKYSGYTFALRHCLAEIYKRNPDLYIEMACTINPGIYANYKEVSDFWDRHKNVSEPVFKETYSTFLKANNQSKGIKSYSYVVALYVNYFLEQKL
jgi:hypothetical protein